MSPLPIIALVLVTTVATASADEPSLIKVLFQPSEDGLGFTPPQKNKALKARLAKHPQLTFFEACGVGDAAEVARQLERDPKLALAWNEFGWTPLHFAAFSGSPEVVKLLLDRGAPIDARARTKFKNTPLQAALLTDQAATVKVLIERGADVLVRQAHGFTPLQGAALHGRRDLVEMLLAAGAELDSRADDGRTAVTEALRGKHPDIAAFLKSKGGHGAEITADLMVEPKD